MHPSDCVCDWVNDTLSAKVKFFHTKIAHPCLCVPCFVSCWNTKGPSPNCCHKSWKYEIATKYLGMQKSLRVPFSGTKDLSSMSENA